MGESQQTPQITIDLRSPAPAVRQLIDQLRHLLVTGALKPGGALPSVRRLAIELGLNHNTIAEAYRALAAEGWLDLAQGRSVRVREREQEPVPSRTEQKELRISFQRRMQHLIAEMRAQGVSQEWIARQLRQLGGDPTMRIVTRLRNAKLVQLRCDSTIKRTRSISRSTVMGASQGFWTTGS